MNKKDIAVSFLHSVTAGKINEAYKKYVHPLCRHHNAYFKGDAESLKKGMEENHTRFPKKVYEMKHVAEKRDIVMVHGHVRLEPNSLGVAVIHIFRFERDKIIEMWDVSQPLPEDSPNENGMF